MKILRRTGGVVAAAIIIGAGGGSLPDEPRGTPHLATQETMPANGMIIGDVAHVRPGQAFLLDAPGYAPGTSVELEVAGQSWRQYGTADSTGRLSFRFAIPAGLSAGRYKLSLTGAAHGDQAVPAPAPNSMQIMVTIPQVSYFCFSLD